MPARCALVVSLLVLVAAQVRADDVVVELEYAVFHGCRDPKAVDAWLEVKLAELEAAHDEGSGDAQAKGRLAELRAKLAKLAAAMGTHVPVHMLFTESAARIEAGTRVTVVRLDAEAPYVADWDSAEPTATRVPVTALAANAANQAIKITSDGMSGKKKTINDQPCADYKLSGGIDAQVWVASDDDKGLAVVQTFCNEARSAMGGFRGEPLWAVVDEAQNLPVIAFVGGVKGGLAFDGKPRALAKPYAMVLLRVTQHASPPIAVAEWVVPADKKVVEDK